MTTSRNIISHRTGVSTFASRTSPSTGQSLQKSFHLSHADKIELKKISSPSENKKYPTAQPDTTKMMKRSIVNGLQRRWTEGQLITAVWRNGGLSASYDSFVGKQTLVLCINICGKNPPLRQAAFQDQKQVFPQLFLSCEFI
jgi:hypothetical protein